MVITTYVTDLSLEYISSEIAEVGMDIRYDSNVCVPHLSIGDEVHLEPFTSEVDIPPKEANCNIVCGTVTSMHVNKFNSVCIRFVVNSTEESPQLIKEFGINVPLSVFKTFPMRNLPRFEINESYYFAIDFIPKLANRSQPLGRGENYQ